MHHYIDIIKTSYQGYWNYLINQELVPSWNSYFYWLLSISLFFWLLEIGLPWRKKQAIIRKDFWLDFFYMFFNFFLFSLIVYNAFSNIVVDLFNDLLLSVGINKLAFIDVQSWPKWGQLLTLFVVRDFVQWNIHRLLHRVEFLWCFHKVHHSVKQMGFAAHLRYHWMETIVYRTLEYIPLAIIGFGIDDFIIVHLVTIFIGHFNHSNFTIPLGPLKYVFNNPEMHIWHHAKVLPNKYGVNFGISLSIWDYLFGTSYVPHNGRDIELGFKNDEQFPQSFIKQELYGFLKPINQNKTRLDN